MTHSDCSRAWQAEAVEEGRLGGTERLSFERHVASCPVCAHEVAALAALRRVMQHAPSLASAPLEQQRLRAALLSRANEAMVGPSARPTVRWLVASASAVTLCVIVGTASYLLSRRRSQDVPSASSTSTSTPSFEIVGESGSEWLDRSVDGVGRVVLHKGTIGVHVRHLKPGQRFLLALPDAEIEVYGTRFVVAVLEHQTQHVEVREGVVALRVHGQPEQLLRAGKRWDRVDVSAAVLVPRAEPASASASPKTVATQALRAQPEPLGAQLPSMNTRRAPSNQPAAHKKTRSVGSTRVQQPASGSDGAAQQRSLSGDAAAPQQLPKAEAELHSSASATSLAAQRFADAVAVFHARAYRNAEARLAQFAYDFPNDPRSEDVAFLRAVACFRAGDKREAAKLASAYLKRFPRGLRHHEAQRILTQAQSR